MCRPDPFLPVGVAGVITVGQHGVCARPDPFLLVGVAGVIAVGQHGVCARGDCVLTATRTDILGNAVRGV